MAGCTDMVKIAGEMHFRSIDKRLRLSTSYFKCDCGASTMQFTAHRMKTIALRHCSLINRDHQKHINVISVSCVQSNLSPPAVANRLVWSWTRLTWVSHPNGILISAAIYPCPSQVPTNHTKCGICGNGSHLCTACRWCGRTMQCMEREVANVMYPKSHSHAYIPSTT